MVDMYLHQNFKSCRSFVEHSGHDLLASGRKVRLTGIRMLTGASVKPVSGGGSSRGRRSSSGTAGSTLLLTEYLAFVLDHRNHQDLRLATEAFGQTLVIDTLDEKSNQEPYFVVCKVVEVRRPRLHQDRTADTSSKRRLMLQTVVLECAGASRGGCREEERTQSRQATALGDGERQTVLLHLWDEQMCLASLFRKGDGLAIFWPWVMRSDVPEVPAGERRGNNSEHQSLASPSQESLRTTEALNATGWHYEYGSATAFFVLPQEGRAVLLSAARGNSGAAVAVAGQGTDRGEPELAAMEGPCAEGVPADENGVRDVRKYPRRISVANIAPNMTNLSIYGQVVSVSVTGETLPAVIPPRQHLAGGQSQTSLSQQMSKPLLLLPPATATDGGGVRDVHVVELQLRDESGEIQILCCGQEAVVGALACRPGHFVLACGLRTFAPAVPRTTFRRGGDVVVICGETLKAREGVGTGDGIRLDAWSGSGGEGGTEGFSKVLNASCLEGLLHCPFLSRHTLLHTQEQAKDPQASFVCKGAVTWARWAFAGDNVWAVHRPCLARLPCGHSSLDKNITSQRLTSRKRWRDVPKPGEGRNTDVQGMSVSCPRCKCSVNVTSAEEVLLSFAPLLLALDDGSRCLLAECRGEVVASALGGIHADVFLHMNQEEQKVILDTLVGRELRCLVGRNGAGMDNDDQPGPGGGRGNIPRRSRNYDGGVGAGQNDGSGWNSCSRVSDVHYRVERIASANPAADLAHALECAI
ncbi:unnamed protein product [Sphacelaria rigidula]